MLGGFHYKAGLIVFYCWHWPFPTDSRRFDESLTIKPQKAFCETADTCKARPQKAEVTLPTWCSLNGLGAGTTPWLRITKARPSRLPPLCILRSTRKTECEGACAIGKELEKSATVGSICGAATGRCECSQQMYYSNTARTSGTEELRASPRSAHPHVVPDVLGSMRPQDP